MTTRRQYGSGTTLHRSETLRILAHLLPARISRSSPSMWYDLVWPASAAISHRSKCNSRFRSGAIALFVAHCLDI